MEIFYGTSQNKINVTAICLDKLLKYNQIMIFSDEDCRNVIFSDPCPFQKKYIFIYDENKNLLGNYDNNYMIKIDMSNKKIDVVDTKDAKNRLNNIHQILKIDYGKFNEEYPEQLLVSKYLTGNEKILEFGGNIGRNSIVIAYILNQNNNECLVSLETDQKNATILKHNRDLNNLRFSVENAGLSKNRLIQNGWVTIPSNDNLENFNTVNSITWENLYEKYKIDFDTLIVDCEGAFYYILIDYPDILKNINLLIIENDFQYEEHKQFFNKTMIDNGFYLDYIEALNGSQRFITNFYEVWRKG
jgi:FkbM family methyltransferase